MVSRHPNAPGTLSREEKALWWDAFVAALPIVLGSNGNLAERASNRLAELTAEMAWASLDQYRRAAKGQRS